MNWIIKNNSKYYEGKITPESIKLGFEAKVASGEIKFVAEIPKTSVAKIDKPITGSKNNFWNSNIFKG